MATEKNITMKQFNGTDYDTLYPKTIASQIPDVYSKTDTITAGTLSQLGLTADKLPNDAFQQIKTLIDNVQSSADSKARIQTGSYVGTGTYGPDNPCSLTFDFEPQIIIIAKYSTAVLLRGQYSVLVSTGSVYSTLNFVMKWEGNKITWWYNSTNEYGPGYQANEEGSTYRYCAIY